ncbi:tRNA lysidine(34) synthetase TilS [Pseudomonas stutzeri]|uniref:tRNA(Ile)-lysidine synthase n=1 Tax=Stutzerimonas stutzeri TaxID=316 RepID=A0A2N8S2Y0_STUST|nr:tRNA lysidine(34) synthetase TilS [Stutzerimonas stutzeri]MCQ4296542.1 tRNA lysidine(34) synthetase TilS [Stutzerimonas stutzeri]PNF80974.1 tRNA lysidine(34) synthetase TilS [Stutzerimonas stutzeri]
MSLDSLLLSALTPWRSSPTWWVAFSGGLDSTVLLHVLTRLADRHQLPVIRAIHVHHGLQAVADDWPAHCQGICDELGVLLNVVQVQVESGASMEQAARNARYQAFSDCLGEGELLLTGQHRDDQAETVLFRLLRGAGVRGLAAMPGERPLGRGRLARPLLGVPREELEAYARSSALTWVEDPSNQQYAHTRNYLRREILPLLKQRWPQAASTLARTAAHMAEAQELMDELAQQDIRAAKAASSDGWLSLPNLALPALRALTPVRQRNVLRYWLAGLTLAPDEAHWAGWLSLRDAKSDATPRWRLVGGELQRSGDRIWWLPDAWLKTIVAPVDWPDPAARLVLPSNGALRVEGVPPTGKLQIRYRKGGEALLVPGRGRRDLKRLLNEAGVPAFVRGRLPLLYCDDELVAVANLPQLSDGGFALIWCAPTF